MRKGMAGLVAVAALAAAVAVPVGAETSLVADWQLDEGGGASAADSSGFGHTGAVTGGAHWVPGKWGSGLDFDGTTGRVEVAPTAALRPAAVTVSAWVRSDGFPGRYAYLVAKGAAGCIASSYALYTGPEAGLIFYVSSSDGADYVRSPDAGPGVWDGGWHHVAGTYDGTAVRLFVDGVEVGTGTAKVEPIDYGLSDDRLYLGHYAGCSGLDYAGALDSVRIFSRALTPAEVKSQLGFPFRGFLPPIDNKPTINVVKAGSAVPVRFGLDGYRGLDIFTAGGPSTRRVGCSDGAALDAIELTVTPGASGLAYDATNDVYSYVMKTEKSWAETCREFSLGLIDGSSHTATFRFS